ncbi:hypothetical protein [Tsuneonella amylolytica]|uniref:hypothetical protein n=1 Tax=Tsuneonella amylolytica TaxID=2338327 RepID=UPI000EA90EAC|nr:hypothetical protein [Tsuneonella amylolytica]
MTVRLIRDIEETVRKATPEHWEIITIDWSVLLSSPVWKSNRGLGKGDVWSEIREIAADDEDQV